MPDDTKHRVAVEVFDEEMPKLYSILRDHDYAAKAFAELTSSEIRDLEKLTSGLREHFYEYYDFE